MAESRWVHIKIDASAHEALCHLASNRGIHSSQLAAEFVEKSLAKEGDKEEADLETQIFAEAHRAEKEKIIEQQLERIAWMALRKDDEKLTDRLQTLCGKAGYDVQEMIDRASQFKRAPIVVGRNGTGKSAAMRWLQDRFAEQDEWLVREIRDELGEKAGFSAVTLNRAKRELGVTSEKRSTYWIWTLEGDEQQHHQHLPYSTD